MKYFLILSPLIFFVPFFSQAQSDNESWVRLSPAEIYERCWIKLTRSVLPLTDPNFILVKNNQKNPEDACIELFDKGQLVQNADKFNLQNPTDTKSRNVLKTIQDLHKSWFKGSIRIDSQFARQNSLIQDAEEYALYFTKASLGQGLQFSSVFSGSTPLRGVRTRDYTDILTPFRQQTMYSYNSATKTAHGSEPAYQDSLVVAVQPTVSNANANLTTKVLADSDLVTFGELIGIESAPAITIPLIFPIGLFEYPIQHPTTKDAIQVQTKTPGNCIPSFSTTQNAGCLDFKNHNLSRRNNVDLNAHAGGGILGSNSFISHNTNLEVETIPFYAFKNHRRLATRVYEDLLCQSLPLLNISDVTNDIVADSVLPFQKSTSCLSCHSTIDPLAETWRHVMTIKSGPQSGSQNAGASMLGLYIFDKNPVSTAFNLQAPMGKLKFRLKSTGQMIEETFEGPAGLGQKLSTLDLFYQCSAKRYYKFLTGIDVSLDVIETQTNLKMHQDFVLNTLAPNLKTNQSVRSLFLTVFQNDIYKTRNYKAESKK